MGVIADELRAGIGEVARKLAGARLAGDHFSAEAYRGRLRCMATRHGVGASAEPADPGGAGEGLR